MDDNTRSGKVCQLQKFARRSLHPGLCQQPANILGIGQGFIRRINAMPVSDSLHLRIGLAKNIGNRSNAASAFLPV